MLYAILIIFIILLLISLIVVINNLNKIKYNKDTEIQNQLKQIEEKNKELKNKEQQLLLNEQESLHKIESEKLKSQSDIDQIFIDKQKSFEESIIEKQEKFDKQFETKHNELNDKLVSKETEVKLYIQQLEIDTNKKIVEIQDNLHKYEDLQRKVSQAYLENERTEKQLEFYKINLDDIEKSDISILKPIADRISKPVVLYKLLYEIYYKTKLETMFKQVLSNCPTKGGIYKITNINDHKIYIGKAKDILSRWRQHAKEGINLATSQSNSKLYIAMQKEGIENFTFEVVDSCTDDLLDEREKYWILYYNSIEYGYNSKIG